MLRVTTPKHTQDPPIVYPDLYFRTVFLEPDALQPRQTATRRGAPATPPHHLRCLLHLPPIRAPPLQPDRRRPERQGVLSLSNQCQPPVVDCFLVVGRSPTGRFPKDDGVCEGMIGRRHPPPLSSSHSKGNTSLRFRRSLPTARAFLPQKKAFFERAVGCGLLLLLLVFSFSFLASKRCVMHFELSTLPRNAPTMK